MCRITSECFSPIRHFRFVYPLPTDLGTDIGKNRRTRELTFFARKDSLCILPKAFHIETEEEKTLSREQKNFLQPVSTGLRKLNEKYRNDFFSNLE